jgi:hypothetical protein
MLLSCGIDVNYYYEYILHSLKDGSADRSVDHEIPYGSNRVHKNPPLVPIFIPFTPF